MPMSELGGAGKLLIGLGVVLVVVGGILWLLGSASDKFSWIGRLPGDINIQRGNWHFYFPLATSILVSVILTVLFSLFFRR